MADVRPLHAPRPEGATGVVVFADGRTVWGQGFGAEGEAVEEMDLAKEVSRLQVERWSGGKWDWAGGYEISPLPLAGGEEERSSEGVGASSSGASISHNAPTPQPPPASGRGGRVPHVVAVD